MVQNPGRFVQGCGVKLFLDTTDVERQPRRWAALVQANPPARAPGSVGGSGQGNREREWMLVLNYLAKQVTSVRKVIVQKRRPVGFRARPRYLVRPLASAETTGAHRTWLGLVCDYDVAKRALRVVDRVPILPGPLTAFERVYAGDISVESRAFAPAYCDAEAVGFLERLPEAAEDVGGRTDHWRAYLDWRRKLAETKGGESYGYVGWERRGHRLVRFWLREHLAPDRLRARFRDEDLRAGADARDPREPQGVFRRVGIGMREGTQRRVAVELEFDAETWRTLELPPHGELRVAVEGELATLEVQLNGLRRLAERQAQNPFLSEWLFDIAKARPIDASKRTLPRWRAFSSLNEEQREAVDRALSFDDLLLLWGPPGTGKTTVIAEICAQYAMRGQRVLVTSQANLAVEQALGRLPLSPAIRSAWISTARRRDAQGNEVETGLRRWYASLAEAAREAAVGAVPPWREWFAAAAECFGAAAEQRIAPEDEARYLRSVNVIGATCNEAGKPDFIASPRFTSRFDLVIVDEVSKATPPELLLGMLMGRRILLVGDHRQLPPLFRDEPFEDAIEAGEIDRGEVEGFRDMVTASLFDGYFRGADSSVSLGLRRQYRMHPQIMAAVNHFYPDHPLLAGDRPDDLARARGHGIECEGLLSAGASLLWVDPGANERGEERLGSSRRNREEAEWVARLLHRLGTQIREQGMTVGVISFYRAQVELIRDVFRSAGGGGGLLNLSRGVNTVDQFQGSERDVVIVSLVRTGTALTGEFARDFRRINVALSRARRLLIIVGSRETFASAAVKVPTANGGEQMDRVYARIIKAIAEAGNLRVKPMLPLAPPLAASAPAVAFPGVELEARPGSDPVCPVPTTMSAETLSPFQHLLLRALTIFPAGARPAVVELGQRLGVAETTMWSDAWKDLVRESHVDEPDFAIARASLGGRNASSST